MKCTILVNPYDVYPVQKRKTARMKEELALLGVETEVVANDEIVAYVRDGRTTCDLHTDCVLYFDKERITAKLLEKAGVRLFNRASATEICDDKMLTHALLADNDIPMSDTVSAPLCYNPSAPISEVFVRKAVQKLGLPIVVKECHGSFGEQVYLCRTQEELLRKLEEVKLKPHLLQRFEESSSGRDMRVIVIGGKAVCAIQRRNDADFRSNASLGGTCERVDIPDDIADICQRASQMIGLDYCGVDVLLISPPKICEVNSNAMFEAMEQATGVNVARLYAEHIVRTVGKKQ